jgi:long-chain acyl-CoA synthetase
MKYKSPLDKLYHWERTRPDKVFLHQPINNVWHTWTWSQATQEVGSMAAALKAMNLPPHSPIALISRNCAHWILCDLAIMLAGHISVPLYPNLTTGTIGQILEHSGSRVLFVGKLDNWELMKEGVPKEVKCISFPIYSHEEYENWDDIIKKYQPLGENIEKEADEIATIVYTSGTTGKPKGVIHNYHNLSFVPSQAMPFLGISDQERFFSYLPLSHIAERMLVEMGALYSGGEIFFAESLETFSKNLAEAKPTVFLAVHRIWKKFQLGILEKISQEKLDRLLRIPLISWLVKRKIKKGLGLAKATNIFTGAGPTPVPLLEWFEKVGINIQEAYAMTENCCYSHVTCRQNIRLGYVGTPLPGCDVKLSEENEILIRHEAIMTGYYNEPQATKDAFTSDGFLKTGDEGLCDAEGFLKITGRIKDQFKTSKGKYVVPSPIELKISEWEDVELVCLVGTELPQPMALVVASEKGRNKTRQVLEHSLEEKLVEINRTLDPHEHIAKMVLVKEPWSVENHLLTPSFKIKRGMVEKKYNPQSERWYAEKEVVIWEE